MSELFPVKPHIAARSHLSSRDEYDRLYRLSLDNPDWFWSEQAKAISWFHPFQVVFDADYDEVDFAWYSAGRLNASFNCVDRHLEDIGDRTAIIWAQDEPGAYQHISYRELKHNVGRVANVLHSHGIRRGDRVCIYMGMMPELVYTMLACARIGAVHTVVFGGFSSEALRDRIVDARCRIVVTANEGLRGGKHIPLKQTVDRAVEGMSMVETVLVARRTDREVPMIAGRDFWLDEEGRKQRSTCTNEWMGAEDPLFILSRRAAPASPRASCIRRAATWSTRPSPTRWSWLSPGRHLLLRRRRRLDHRPHVHRLRPAGERARTTVIFESTPTYPDPGRYWRIVDDLGVNIFYTSPTALRDIAQGGARVGEAVPSRLASGARERGPAHQPRDLALVSRRCGREPLRRRGHVVADGDRGHPHHTPAGCHPDEAWLGHPAVLRGQAVDLGYGRREDPGGQRRERSPVPGDAMAGTGRTVWGDHHRSGDLLHPVPGALLPHRRWCPA